jgi:hypothetical protein
MLYTVVFYYHTQIKWALHNSPPGSPTLVRPHRPDSLSSPSSILSSFLTRHHLHRKPIGATAMDQPSSPQTLQPRPTRLLQHVLLQRISNGPPPASSSWSSTQCRRRPRRCRRVHRRAAATSCASYRPVAKSFFMAIWPYLNFFVHAQIHPAS